MGRVSPFFKLGSAYRVIARPASDLALTTSERQVSVWDTRARAKVARLRDIRYPSGLAISPDGQHLAVKSTQGMIGLYDLSAMRLTGVVHPTPTEGAEPAFTPDGRYLVDADWDGFIRLIDVETLAVTPLAQYANCMVRAVERPRGGVHFLFLVTPNQVDAPAFSGEVLLDWRYPFDQHSPIERVTAFWSLSGMRVGPIRRRVAVCGVVNSSDKSVREGVFLLDPETVTIDAQVNMTLLSGTALTPRLVWSPDERYLAVVLRDSVALLEAETLIIIHRIALEYACCVEFTPDGTALLLGSWQSGYYAPLKDIWSITRLR